jgi:type II secretory pathway predicted ATPase ExeA
VLVGHPELRRRLGMAVHEALNQRIIVRHHLSGLLPDELSAYIAHRLRLAGSELPLFEPAALVALHQATGGLVRKVNNLAHHALIAAALMRAKVVTAEHVQAALPEVS